ncbi:MAG: hypothetical protein ACP5E2_13630 [Terracidiphilus sp.]
MQSAGISGMCCPTHEANAAVAPEAPAPATQSVAFLPRSTDSLIANAATSKSRPDLAVQRLRPKPTTVAAVILSLAPILWETGIGSDVMKPIAVPIADGMITSTIHVPILAPVFFLPMKRRHLHAGKAARR